jgi:hypothetical protein
VGNPGGSGRDDPIAVLDTGQTPRPEDLDQPLLDSGI